MHSGRWIRKIGWMIYGLGTKIMGEMEPLLELLAARTGRMGFVSGDDHDDEAIRGLGSEETLIDI